MKETAAGRLLLELLKLALAGLLLQRVLFWILLLLHPQLPGCCHHHRYGPLVRFGRYPLPLSTFRVGWRLVAAIATAAAADRVVRACRPLRGGKQSVGILLSVEKVQVRGPARVPAFASSGSTSTPAFSRLPDVTISAAFHSHGLLCRCHKYVLPTAIMCSPRPACKSNNMTEGRSYSRQESSQEADRHAKMGTA